MFGVSSTGATSYAIELDGLCKSYGYSPVLDDLNLKIEKGVFYALMGRNGSGKSTLIRIISCISLPTRGSVKVNGFCVVKEAEKVRRIIGYVPQENFSCPILTGRENLVYFSRLYGFSRKESIRLSGKLLEAVGLSEYADQRVSEYSGGMRKRLEVSTALFPGVEVLLLDEPTTGLDPTARKEFMEMLKGINNTGATIFLVTHIGEDAEEASKVGFIMDGGIILEGSPLDLKHSSGLTDVIEVETAYKSDSIAVILRSLSEGGRLEENGKGYRIYSRQPDDAIPLILKALRREGCSVGRVESRAPSLEDVFFKVTRRSLKE